MLTGKKYWDTIAGGYSKTGGAKWVRHPWTIRLAGSVFGKKVLELGCGTGVIISSLAKKGAIGTGVDYSGEMLGEAERIAKTMRVAPRFIRADIRDLSTLKGETFDLIIVSAVLVTFPSVRQITKILSEAYNVLAPNGTILIAEPHPFFDHYMRGFLSDPAKVRSLDYQAKGKKYPFDMVDGAGHSVTSVIYHWRLEDYATALYDAGFTIRRIFEPKPIPSAKQDSAWYAKRVRYAAYLFIQAVKTH